MNNKERLEKIEEIIVNLKELNYKIPIIVEGERDEETLRILGFQGKILKINIGISIFNFCEEISKEFSYVIILTDWDAQGGKICNLLKKKLKANGIKYDTKNRRDLAKFCKKEIKDVEGLRIYKSMIQ